MLARPPGTPTDAGKPALLIDVDGVISLWGLPPDRRPRGAYAMVDGIPHFLSQEVAETLLGLLDVFEPVWCTGWEDRANDHLPHLLGLGPWPYLEFDRDVAPGRTTPGHWKLSAIDAAFGPERPLAWIDDDLNDAVDAWAGARPGRTLLVRTTPSEGLTAAQARDLRSWAAGTPTPG